MFISIIHLSLSLGYIVDPYQGECWICVPVIIPLNGWLAYAGSLCYAIMGKDMVMRGGCRRSARLGIQGVQQGSRIINGTTVCYNVGSKCCNVHCTSFRCALFLFLQRDIQSDKSDLCQASLQTLGHCLYQDQIARLVYSIKTVN